MAKRGSSDWRRPRSLFEVVRDAASAEDIGYHLADFLDHVNWLGKQPSAAARVAASLRTEPPRTGDAVQDAYLAAVAAHLAHGLRLRAPAWTEKKNRWLDRPWFALPEAWNGPKTSCLTLWGTVRRPHALPFGIFLGSALLQHEMCKV